MNEHEAQRRQDRRVTPLIIYNLSRFDCYNRYTSNKHKNYLFAG